MNMAQTMTEWTKAPMTGEVTSAMFRDSGVVDEEKYGKFLAKTVKSNKRCRDKAKPGGLWHGFTDEECVKAAESYCHMYRHQFRIFVKVDTMGT